MAAQKGAENSGSPPEKATSKRATGKKADSQEATGRKATGGRTTARKTAVRKTTGRKTAPRKSAASSGGRRSSDAPRAESRPGKVTATRVAGAAVEQLAQLAGKEVEGVTGVERGDHGWTVQVEVLELRRVPSTTDVLAVYEVTLDEDGDLEGYRRLDRYVRGVPGEGGR